MKKFMSSMGRSMSVENSEAPLTDEQIQQFTPAVFGDSQWNNLSSKYSRIHTPTLMDKMRAEGFQPFFASQVATKNGSWVNTARHMVRFRHEDTFGIDAKGTEFEIIMINAHDGTSSFNLIPGLFRFVCDNGLMTGETFASLTLKHQNITMGDVIEGSYEVLREAPKLAGVVDKWQDIKLDEARRNEFAERAHVIRFPGATMTQQLREAPIDAGDLLHHRRVEDRDNDLWTVFNVVQENILRGGQEGHLTRAGNNGLIHERSASTRPVGSISNVEYYNRQLWDVAEEFALAA